MKKLIILSVVLFFTSLAYSYEPEGLSVGIRTIGSVSWLNIRHTDMESDGSALKGAVGMVASYHFHPIFAIVSGINYNKSGGFALDSHSAANPLYKSSYKLNYSAIELPAQIRLQTRYFDNFSLYFQTGVLFDLIINTKRTLYPTDNSGNAIVENYNSKTRFAAIAGQVSVGLEYPLGERFVAFGELGYNSTLTNISSEKNSGFAENPIIKPQQFGVSLGILFR